MDLYYGEGFVEARDRVSVTFRGLRSFSLGCPPAFLPFRPYFKVCVSLAVFLLTATFLHYKLSIGEVWRRDYLASKSVPLFDWRSSMLGGRNCPEGLRKPFKIVGRFASRTTSLDGVWGRL